MSLTCPGCGWAFETLWCRDDGRLVCPRCERPACPCGCGSDMTQMRVDAVYASEACEKRCLRRESTDKAPTATGSHPLAQARHEQEASALNKRLGDLIRLGIVHCIETHGQAHADDLESYFPAEHVERCRKLVPGQFGSLASRHYIKGIEYRKSTVPARKGGKSWVYILTEEGEGKLVGLSAGGSPDGDGGASVESGESDGPIGRSQAQSQKPDDDSGAGAPPETLSLLAAPDPETWAA